MTATVITWHRRPAVCGDVPAHEYWTETPGWEAWTVLAVPCSNGSRTHWPEFQVRHAGRDIGMRHLKLRHAKILVARYEPGQIPEIPEATRCSGCGAQISRRAAFWRDLSRAKPRSPGRTDLTGTELCESTASGDHEPAAA